MGGGGVRMVNRIAGLALIMIHNGSYIPFLLLLFLLLLLYHFCIFFFFFFFFFFFTTFVYFSSSSSSSSSKPNFDQRQSAANDPLTPRYDGGRVGINLWTQNCFVIQLKSTVSNWAVGRKPDVYVTSSAVELTSLVRVVAQCSQTWAVDWGGCNKSTGNSS